MSNTNPVPNAAFTDLEGVTVLTALDASRLAYEQYDTLSGGGVLSPIKTSDPSEIDLEVAGWKFLPRLPNATNDKHSYQGVAMYKVINGVTEVIIANRGSQTVHDFLTSDRQLAFGITPRSDTDAMNFYNDVVDWLSNPANGVSRRVFAIPSRAPPACRAPAAARPSSSESWA